MMGNSGSIGEQIKSLEAYKLTIKKLGVRD